MDGNISIVIADDHLLFADGLRLLLHQQRDFCILDIANSGKELLEILDKLVPDILLLDINMPGINGLDTLSFVRKINNSTRVIMLSTYNESHLIKQAIKSGANGYVIKNFGPDELAKAIRQVDGGENYFPVMDAHPAEINNQEDSFLKQFSLTNREKEILCLIGKDHTNYQISQKLFLSIYTVETHRKNIMQKLKLRSPGALMRFILEHNL